MRFDLRHIRYFMAVAEELHFRRAAERLGVAQPALSRAVKHLEIELDVLLFERSNRSVRMTSAGEAFYNGSESLWRCLESAVENTKLASQGKSGPLRIGYTDAAISGRLPNLLKDFQKLQPNVVIQPMNYTTVNQIDMLETDALDIGFVTGPVTRKGYDTCHISFEKYICVVCDEHPLATRRSVRLEELADENFVHGEQKGWQQFHAGLFPLCQSRGFTPRIVQEAFNSAGVLSLVSAAMGITILAESAQNSLCPGVVVIPIEDVNEKLETIALWQPGSADSPLALFVDYLLQAVYV
jgi:DNA-binding transcriptional LysR family regulator